MGSCRKNRPGLLGLESGEDGGFDFRIEGGVGFENLLGGVASLGDLGAFVADPGAAFFEDVFFESEIQEGTGGGNSLVIHDVEFRFGKRRGDFVFDDFEFGPVADDRTFGTLDRSDAADVATHARIEFERLAAGRGLGVSKHDTDFFADLVCENNDGVGLRDEGGQLAQGGAHEAGLGTHDGVADFSLEFGFRDESGNGVNDDNVEGVRADEGFADAEGFLARAGLGDEEVIEIDTEALGVGGIQGVLDINESGEPAAFLGLGHDGQRERGFSGGFRPVNFHDASPGKASDAQGAVDEEIAGGDDFHFGMRIVAEAHDGTLAIIFGDLLDGQIEILGALGIDFRGGFGFGCRSFVGFGGHKIAVGFVKGSTLARWVGIEKHGLPAG